MGEEPFESAQREIFEETGLKIDELELTAILFINVKSNPGIQVFVFKAVYISGKPKNSNEGNLIWMTKNEIMFNKQVLSDVIGLIETCENYKKGEKPKILKYYYDESDKLRIAN